MKRSRVLLGTFVEVLIDIPITNKKQNEFLQSICNVVFKEMEIVQELMSIHTKTSEISKINGISSKCHPFKITLHPWTYEVLLIAKNISEITGGIFDCGIGQHLSNKNKDTSFAGIRDIEFKDGHQILIPKSIQLDLGGVAKGYAVDRGIEILKRFGIERAIINAGGDLRVYGAINEKIFIQQRDFRDEWILLGELTDGAVATTGSLFKVKKDQKRMARVIHPITGKEIKSQLSYSVVAPSCVVADGLTKALAIEKNINAPYFKKLQAVPIIVE
jgi:thiamine biosynthesis lipoprotein